jgi:hypothetical protein
MTRKILVPIDIDDPRKIIKDFLYPKPTENGFALTGIKSNKKADFGRVILTSEINENDLLKRIVDSGIRIESVENLLNALKNYVERIPNYKIGNILEIDNSNSRLEFKIKYQRLTRKK